VRFLRTTPHKFKPNTLVGFKSPIIFGSLPNAKNVGYKGKTTITTDPLTGKNVPLFHPRQQQWTDHFIWSVEGTKVEGLTPIGRGTVICLRLNHPVIVSARRRWVSSGWHPPSE